MLLRLMVCHGRHAGGSLRLCCEMLGLDVFFAPGAASASRNWLFDECIITNHRGRYAGAGFLAESASVTIVFALQSQTQRSATAVKGCTLGKLHDSDRLSSLACFASLRGTDGRASS